MDDAPKIRTKIDGADNVSEGKQAQARLSHEASPVGKETAAMRDPHNASQQTVDKHFTSSNDLLAHFNNETKQTAFKDGSTQSMQTSVNKNSVEFNASTKLADGRTNEYNGKYTADGKYSSSSLTRETNGAESVYKTGPNGESSIQSHNADKSVSSRNEFGANGQSTYSEKLTENSGVRTTQYDSPTTAGVITDKMNPNGITRLNETTIDKTNLAVKSVAYPK